MLRRVVLSFTALLCLAAPARADVETPLESGAPVTARLPEADLLYRTFTIEVPAGSESLAVALTATGDADVYVRAGSPIEANWVDEATAYSNSLGGSELVLITSKTRPALEATTYWIDVVHGRIRQDPQPLEYTLTVTIDGDETAMAGGGSRDGIREDATVPVTIAAGGANFQTFQVVVEPDVESLELTLRGASGDMDLYARYGAAMTSWDQADHLANGRTADETLVLRRQGPRPLRTGVYHVDVARVGEETRSVTFGVRFRRGRAGGSATEDVGGAPPAESTENDVTGEVRQNSRWSLSMPAGQPNYRTYTIFVPKGAESLLIRVMGAQQDLDLYLRHEKPIQHYGRDPDHSSNSLNHDEQLYLDGSSDPPLSAGKYYLDIVRYGAEAAVGPVECAVLFDVPRPEPLAASSAEIQDIEVGTRIRDRIERSAGKSARYRFDVPRGARSLHVAVVGATRDLDLFLRRGGPVTDYSNTEGYDHRLVTNRLSEWLELDADSDPPLRAGTYYLDVVSLVSADINVTFTLLVTVNEPPELLAEDFSLPPFPLPDDASDLERALRATVQVTSDNGAGSGTCLSPTGLVLTAHHVLEEDGELQREGIYVSFPAELDQPPVQVFVADVVEVNAELDLALLAVRADIFERALPPDLDLPWLRVGDSDALALGEPLLVAGYPSVGGDESRSSISLTRGIVSGFLADGDGGRTWLKTDAQMNSGNSGGTALDHRYRFVGIPSRKLIDEDDQLGYCRPTSTIPASWRGRLRRETR